MPCWAKFLDELLLDQNLARIEQNPVLFVMENAAKVRGLGTSALVLFRSVAPSPGAAVVVRP